MSTYPYFQEIMKGRRSVRKFLDEPVPEADLRKMIDLSSWAPSGSNRQPWRFVVVRDKEILGRMRKAIEDLAESIESPPEDPSLRESVIKGLANYTFFSDAPALFAVCLVPSPSLSQRVRDMKGYAPWPLPFADIMGVGAAIQNLLLSAHALGYGACWMTGPLIAQRELESLLGIERPWHLVSLIPVGKPAVSPGPAPRRDDIVSWR
jgi:nitroreductase